MKIRHWAYLAVITAYVAFGVINTFEDIGYYWIWLLALIIISEVGTWYSIKRRNK